MDIIDAIAAQIPIPEPARTYSDDEVATLRRMARAGGEMGRWAFLQLQSIEMSSPEVLGSTS